MVALLLSTWIGNGLLDFFGISRAAFQVAGGVIVVLIGLSMLRSKTPPEHHDPDCVDRDQNSAVKGVVPLGIPLLVGPGTLTVWSLQMRQRPCLNGWASAWWYCLPWLCI